MATDFKMVQTNQRIQYTKDKKLFVFLLLELWSVRALWLFYAPYCGHFV